MPNFDFFKKKRDEEQQETKAPAVSSVTAPSVVEKPSSRRTSQADTGYQAPGAVRKRKDALYSTAREFMTMTDAAYIRGDWNPRSYLSAYQRIQNTLQNGNTKGNSQYTALSQVLKKQRDRLMPELKEAENRRNNPAQMKTISTQDRGVTESKDARVVNPNVYQPLLAQNRQNAQRFTGTNPQFESILNKKPAREAELRAAAKPISVGASMEQLSDVDLRRLRGAFNYTDPAQKRLAEQEAQRTIDESGDASVILGEQDRIRRQMEWENETGQANWTPEEITQAVNNVRDQYVKERTGDSMLTDPNLMSDAAYKIDRELKNREFFNKYEQLRDYTAGSDYMNNRGYNPAFGWSGDVPEVGIENPVRMLGGKDSDEYKRMFYEAVNGNQDALNYLGYVRDKYDNQLVPTDIQFQKYMSDSDVAMFDFLWNSQEYGPDAAMEYYEGMMPTLEARWNEEENEYVKNLDPVSKLALVATGTVLKPAADLVGFGSMAYDVMSGNDIDPNSFGYRAANSISQGRQALKDDIVGDGSSLFRKGLGVTFDAALSTLDNMYGLALSSAIPSALGITGNALEKITETSTLMLMSTSAAQASVLQNINRGMPQDRAIITGCASGLVEYITEKIGMDNLFNHLLKGETGFKQVLKQALSEGGEEALGSGLNESIDLLYDALSGTNYSDFRQQMNAYLLQNGMAPADQEEAFKQVLWQKIQDTGMEALTGAISGGIMGGTFNAANTIAQNQQNTELARQYGIENGNVDTETLNALIEEGKQYSPSSKAFRKAAQLETMLDKGKPVTGRKATDLYNELIKATDSQDLVPEAIDTAKNKFVPPMNTPQMSAEASRTPYQGSFTENNRFIPRAVLESANAATSPAAVSLRQGVINKAAQNFENVGADATAEVVRKFYPKGAEVNRFLTDVSAVYQAALQNGEIPSTPSLTDSAREAAIMAAQADARKSWMATAANNVTISDALSDESKGVFQEAVTEAAEKGTTTAEAQKAFEAVYNSAFLGAENVAAEATKVLPEATIQKITEAAKKDSVEYTGDLVKRGFARAANAGLQYESEPGVVADVTAAHAFKNGLLQQKTIDSLNQFAKALGVRVRLIDSDPNYNGSYEAEKATVMLALDSIFIKDGTIDAAILGTFGHEITHRMEEISKGAFLNLAKAARETVGSARFDREINSYIKRMPGVDYESALGEVVADYVGKMMVEDENFTDKLLGNLEEADVNAESVGRLRDWIHKAIEWIKGNRSAFDKPDEVINKYQQMEDALSALYRQATTKVSEAEQTSIKDVVFETDNKEAQELSDGNTKYSIREEEPPKKTGVAYKVFLAKDGQLYPPMVANPGGEGTPVGVWLNADEAPLAGLSKTGRPQVQAGGKGTNVGKTSLAYRPGWHLGDVPVAKQFAKTNPKTGVKELFPENFVWAECEYAMDVDYQEEADKMGYMRTNPDGTYYETNKYQHSLAGLKKLPKDGYYHYRTNPNPDTVPWVITGAMKINKILNDDEVAEICRQNGVEPMQRKGGPIDLSKYGLDSNIRHSTRSSVNITDEDFDNDEWLEEEYNQRYMELAQDPEANKKELQRMVDEAAKAAMPNSKLIQDGKFKMMWHHTDKNFTSFLPGTNASSGRLKGIYFTPQETSTMANLGKIHKPYYLNVENPKFAFGVKADRPYVEQLRKLQEGVTDRNQLAEINRKFKEDTGVDAFFDWQNGWYNIMTPEQIKSADLVTYDDNGNVIPLSERFNTDNPDIRYSVRNENEEDISFSTDVEIQNQKVQTQALLDSTASWRQSQTRLDTRQVRKMSENMLRKFSDTITTEQADAITKKVSDLAYKILRNPQMEYSEIERAANKIASDIVFSYAGLKTEETQAIMMTDAAAERAVDYLSNYVLASILQTQTIQGKNLQQQIEKNDRLKTTLEEVRAKRDAKIRQMIDANKARQDQRRESQERDNLLKIMNRVNSLAKKSPAIWREEVSEIVGDLNPICRRLTAGKAQKLQAMRDWAEARKKETNGAFNPNPALLEAISGIDDSYIDGKTESLGTFTSLKDANAKMAEYNNDHPNEVFDIKVVKHAKTGTYSVEVTRGALSIEKVRAITNALLNIEHEIRMMNHTFETDDKREVNLQGQDVIDGIYNSRPLDKNNKPIPVKHAKMIEGLYDELARPETFFRRLIGFDDNNPLYKLTFGNQMSLATGQRAMIDYNRRAHERFFKKYLDNKAFQRSIIGKNARTIEIHGVNENGDYITLKVTPDLLMAIYMHSRNAQNLKHFVDTENRVQRNGEWVTEIQKAGGITIPDFELYKAGKMEDAYRKGTKITMRMADVRHISSLLTNEEMGYIHAAQHYYSDMSQPEINRVSEILNGYSLAMVENYFPIRTDKNYIRSDMEAVKYDAKIESQGWTKERVNASNPITLYGMTDELQRSIDGHSKYVGMAIPIRNFEKVYGVNRFTYDDNGNVQTAYQSSVKDAINKMYGGSPIKYIEKLMKDIQMPSTSKDFFGKLLSKVRSHYAGAVLTLNLGVVVKQAASYPTAAAEIGWKPLIRALADTRFQGKMNMDIVYKYSPLMRLRTEGISTQELGEMKDQGRDIPKFLNWIQGMDVMTVKKLWKASEYYVRQNFKNLQVGTDAYYQKVGEVHSKVIEKTQPNYSSLQRPQILRTDNELVKTLNMFKTQPFQNLNVLMEAFGELKAKQRAAKINDTPQTQADLKRAQKRVAWAVSSQVVSGLVFALMQFAWDWARKKDEKYKNKDGEMTFESWAKKVAVNMGGNAFGMVPFGSALFEAVETATDKIAKTIDPDMEPIFDATFYGIDAGSATDSINDSLKGIVNVLARSVTMAKDLFDNDGNFDWETYLRDTINDAEEVMMFAGIPAENVEKLLTAFAGWGLEGVMGKYESKYWVTRITEGIKSSNKKTYINNLIQAREHGDEHWEDLYETMIYEDAFATTKQSPMVYIDEKIKDYEKEHTESGMTYDQDALYQNTKTALHDSKIYQNASESDQAALDALAVDYIKKSSAGWGRGRNGVNEGVFSLAEYLQFMLALQQVDETNSGSYSQKEQMAAIEALGWSEEKAKEYWPYLQSNTGNPYDKPAKESKAEPETQKPAVEPIDLEAKRAATAEATAKAQEKPAELSTDFFKHSKEEVEASIEEDKANRIQSGTLQSSWLSGYEYNPSTGELKVQANGRWYTHHVPQDVFDAFMAAGSKGSYYSRVIKYY